MNAVEKRGNGIRLNEFDKKSARMIEDECMKLTFTLYIAKYATPTVLNDFSKSQTPSSPAGIFDFA